MVDFSKHEINHLEQVLNRVRESIRKNQAITLPPFSETKFDAKTALHSVGIEPNDYGGIVGNFRYQFEGEEDLLHLFVVRLDGGKLTPEEGQAVAKVILKSVPPGLIWIKPGRYTQHFYFGHDDFDTA